MKTFFEQLGLAALGAILQSGSLALQGGGSLKETGIAAGVAGLFGALQFILQHPSTQSTPIQTAVASVTKPNTSPSLV